jgi:acetyl esterase
MSVDPVVAAILAQNAEAGAPPMSSLSPADARAAYLAMQAPALELTLAKVEDRTIDGPEGPIGIRIYTPEGPGPFPLHVHYHGGGWVIGDLDTHDRDCRTLAREAGCIVVAVDYRLAPGHPFPAAPEDCYAATCWAADHAESLGARSGAITVGGDSAGGNLAAVVCLIAKARGGPHIALQLLIYPVTDHDFTLPSYTENGEGYLLTLETMQWFWDLYCPLEQRDDWRARPSKAASLEGLPEAVIMTAQYDPLRDEGHAYGDALKAAGVPVTVKCFDGMIHSFFSLAHLIPAAQDAVTMAVDALRRAHGEP